MKIEERIARLIKKEKDRLEREIEQFQKKLHDTMEWYGCGGPYARQEKALEAREDELQKLEDFEKQLKKAVPHRELSFYMIGCTRCHTVILTMTTPFSDWHECTSCRSMIYVSNPKAVTLKIADNGEPWQKILAEVLAEQKAREQKM